MKLNISKGVEKSFLDQKSVNKSVKFLGKQGRISVIQWLHSEKDVPMSRNTFFVKTVRHNWKTIF